MTSAWRRNVNTLIISTRTPLTKCDDWRPSNISIHTFLARCDHQKTVPWSYECFYTLHSYEGRLVNWEAKNIEKFLYIPLVWGETRPSSSLNRDADFYTLPLVWRETRRQLQRAWLRYFYTRFYTLPLVWGGDRTSAMLCPVILFLYTPLVWGETCHMARW